MSDSIEVQVRQVAADIFGLPFDEVTRGTSPESVGNWDSVQHLNFVLALESAFSIQLEPEEIEQLRTVGAAVDLIHRKGTSKA